MGGALHGPEFPPVVVAPKLAQLNQTFPNVVFAVHAASCPSHPRTTLR
jgi:hypothetical protein